MSLESELFAALGGLVGGRLYPVTAPPAAKLPYAVYTEFAGAPYVAADGALGLRRGVFQMNVVAATYDAARSVYRQMDGIMNGYQAGTINRMALIGQHVQQDEDTARFVQVMDVEIFYNEVN